MCRRVRHRRRVGCSRRREGRGGEGKRGKRAGRTRGTRGRKPAQGVVGGQVQRQHLDLRFIRSRAVAQGVHRADVKGVYRADLQVCHGMACRGGAAAGDVAPTARGTVFAHVNLVLRDGSVIGVVPPERDLPVAGFRGKARGFLRQRHQFHRNLLPLAPAGIAHGPGNVVTQGSSVFDLEFLGPTNDQR